MNSRERLLAAIHHERVDHVPIWCSWFGFTPPAHLRWQTKGAPVAHWYSKRLEYDHALPEPWTQNDDFERVLRWQSLGLDDVLEVAPPWGMHPDVTVRDWSEPPLPGEQYPRLCRAYQTPAGILEHIVHQTQEDQGPGWARQPAQVSLFDDFNVGRAVRPAVVGEEDLPKLRYLLQDPTSLQLLDYRAQMARVKRFAREHNVLVQGWSAFGMDGIVELCGVEPAIMAALLKPDFFQELVDLNFAFDRRRTELLLDEGGVDVVVEYGWYSSIAFWSPTLIRRYVLPHVRDLANLVHQAGRSFAYVVTTGVLAMAGILLEAGIDLLYWVDPVQDRIDLAAVKAAFGDRLAVAGGVNSPITLGQGTPEEVREAVEQAMQALGPRGFILSPVDALFPDTPWSNVQAMIEKWRESFSA